MKLSNRLKSILAILLISHSLADSAQAAPASASESASKNAAISNKAEKRSESYSGYTVDGRTSASVLTAKRSHAVSNQDETGLAIYSGLIVIGLIVFFVHALSQKK